MGDEKRAPSPPKDSLYVFSGTRFARFIDMEDFKNKVEQILATEISETMPLSKMYEMIQDLYFPNKNEINKILFENILYSDLNHVYLYKFSSPSKVEVQGYKRKLKTIIEDINHKPHIVPALHPAMNENGFYLMDLLDITVLGAKFIAGHDFEETDGFVTIARVLFVEAVLLTNGTVGYNIAGAHIDYSQGTIMVLTQHVEGIEKYDKEKMGELDYDHSVPGIVNRVQNLIINQLEFTMKFDVEADRLGLFSLCRHLDDEMLKDIREIVRTRTSATLSKAADELFHDSKNSPVPDEKQSFIDRTQSSLIGTFINTNVKKTELRKRAKDLKLPGYPTKIDFTSKKSSRSSTESAGARNPISASDMFHSLYISFIQATSLQVFSISWFTDFKYLRPRNTEVIQTTIYATETRFRLVFKSHNPHGKEFLFHVIGQIFNCRKY
ncbi:MULTISPECIES: hypothetical protein [Paenibacillus]|uniref:hypothetical protein n=1 Tax=Paenibacillus TaxID=44249 RepID=UPI00096FCD32|nr:MULTISPECIES: hypothetical protein [Paenibacillus]OMD22985.1 hypothetical protein BJP48_27890 [Paenibacillus odorifer]OME08089.1 hypothetical protein BSK60_30540 [Paenibacillus odorifer]OMF86061.1 hypothetical protein BK147_30815 [Paenibacillus sp. FSL R7-0337]